MKPDCANCIHRGGIIGVNRSQCQHPEVQKILDETVRFQDLVAWFLMLTGTAFPQRVMDAARAMEVKLCPSGLRRNEVTWPFYFLPEDVRECAGEEVRH